MRPSTAMYRKVPVTYKININPTAAAILLVGFYLPCLPGVVNELIEFITITMQSEHIVNATNNCTYNFKK